MFQGEKKTLQVPITDKDGNPANLAGATVKWEMHRDGVTALDKLATIYNANGVADGFQVVIDPSDTVSLDNGTYRHEGRATVSGVPAVLFEGELTLKFSATKD